MLLPILFHRVVTAVRGSDPQIPGALTTPRLDVQAEGLVRQVRSLKIFNVDKLPRTGNNCGRTI
jgi:hypothetical protein